MPSDFGSTGEILCDLPKGLIENLKLMKSGIFYCLEFLNSPCASLLFPCGLRLHNNGAEKKSGYGGDKRGDIEGNSRMSFNL